MIVSVVCRIYLGHECALFMCAREIESMKARVCVLVFVYIAAQWCE